MRPMPAVLSAKAATKPKPLPISEPYQPPVIERPYIPPVTPQVVYDEAPKPRQVSEAVEEGIELPQRGGPLLLDPDKKKREKRHHEKEELQDPSKRDVGQVLRNQHILLRREVYRRRLFPVSFEYAAGHVSEAEIVLGDRPNLAEAVMYFLFLVSFILFIVANAEVYDVYTVNASLKAALNSPTVLSGIAYNALSVSTAEMALKGEVSTSAPSSFTKTLYPGSLVSLKQLRTKADVASWIRDGMTQFFPKIGSSHILCGPCMRFTVRRLEYKQVVENVLGYTSVWPFSNTLSPRSTSSQLQSTSPLYEALGKTASTTTTGGETARLSWKYVFYPKGSTSTYDGKGGYAMTICEKDREAAIKAISQNEPLSRYPPWFVPNGLISSRRTVSVVVDFLSISPYTYSTSYTAISFQFNSAGSMLPVNISTRTSLSSEGKQSAGFRYGTLGVSIFFLLVYLWFLYLKFREYSSFYHFVYEWWNLIATIL
ncbi:polycystin cation channel protein, partial [Cystoisospora suis]